DERRADGSGTVLVNLIGIGAADVVGLENVGVELHRRLKSVTTDLSPSTTPSSTSALRPMWHWRPRIDRRTVASRQIREFGHKMDRSTTACSSTKVWRPITAYGPRRAPVFTTAPSSTKQGSTIVTPSSMRACGETQERDGCSAKGAARKRPSMM